MKNQLIVPVSLAAAALVIGMATVIVNFSNPTGSQPVVSTSAPAETSATVSIQSITDVGTAAAGQASSRLIKWQTSAYPANAHVTINLLKKVSSNPNSYDLVRVVAANTSNDGSETWTPAASETGSGLFVEVVCGNDQSFTAGCKSTSAPMAAF